MNIKLYVFLSCALLLNGCASRYDKMYKQKPAFYSYIAGDTLSGYVRTQHASEVYTTPASCQKVVTALVALKFLGPDYAYETKLYKNNKDVVLAFSGDPSLTSEDLTALLTPLKNTSIKGKILLDTSVFQTPSYSTNLMIGDIGTRFSQPVYGGNIDRNLIKITVTPSTVGSIATAATNMDYKVHSAVTTSLEKTAIRAVWDRDQMKVVGDINKDDKPFEVCLSPQKIEPYTIWKVKDAMKALNIKGRVEIVSHKMQFANDHMKLVATKKSVPLKELIVPALQISDNFAFDSLYLTIAHTYNPDGIRDWTEGDKIIKALLSKHFNIDAEKALFVDGSGMSRYNRLQPKMLFEVLNKGYSVREFVDALPHAGDNHGTLAWHPGLPKNVIAKDGAMLCIRCVCGYGIDKSPKTFVIMTSNFTAPYEDANKVMDKFIMDNAGK